MYKYLPMYTINYVIVTHCPSHAPFQNDSIIGTIGLDVYVGHSSKISQYTDEQCTGIDRVGR